jgi:hypothetical protein
MFTCEPCHREHVKKHAWSLHVFFSYGLCEWCGKNARCADCT